MSKSNAYLNVSKSLSSVIRNFKAIMVKRKKKPIKLLAPFSVLKQGASLWVEYIIRLLY